MNNELYHYGVEGQKWGVRRYQNENGSLTKEGKERYRSSYNKKAISSTAIRAGVGAATAIIGAYAFTKAGSIKNESIKRGAKTVSLILAVSGTTSLVQNVKAFNDMERE